MLRIDVVPVGMLSVNCYVLSDAETKEAYIVDPGADAEAIAALVERNGLRPRAILLTHAHVDHIGAVPAIAARYRVPLWMHPLEKPLYLSPDNALPPLFARVEGLPEPVPEMPLIPGIVPQVIPTPGHTRGGVSYYYPEARLVLTGDTLFKGSYGRTDFPGGSYDDLRDSICNRLFPLGDDVAVHPGHYGSTTIGEEKANHLF